MIRTNQPINDFRAAMARLLALSSECTNNPSMSVMIP